MFKIFAEVDGIKTYHITHLGEEGTELAEARLNIFKKYDICPICKENIIQGGIILLINNCKMFPNTIIHADCCNNFFSNFDVIRAIRDDFKEADKRKYWFNL